MYEISLNIAQKTGFMSFMCQNQKDCKHKSTEFAVLTEKRAVICPENEKTEKEAKEIGPVSSVFQKVQNITQNTPFKSTLRFGKLKTPHPLRR